LSSSSGMSESSGFMDPGLSISSDASSIDEKSPSSAVMIEASTALRLEVIY
jgi:hypothetical protein